MTDTRARRYARAAARLLAVPLARLRMPAYARAVRRATRKGR